jgi:hypothetical protein
MDATLKEINDRIMAVDLKPKEGETRKKFFARVEAEIEDIRLAYVKAVQEKTYEWYDLENMINQFDALDTSIWELKQYGICNECLKFTSVFTGAEFGYWEEYGQVEYEFVCPACQQKKVV